MGMVYLNGKFMPVEQAMVPVLDRGFIFGDGVYEVIPVYGRMPFRLPDHLRRLQASLDGIKLANPLAEEEWGTLIGKVIEQNEWDDQSVYLQVTRGVAPRDHRFPKQANQTVFIMANKLAIPNPTDFEKGVAAITLPDNRWLRCNLKTVSLLGNCLLRQEAEEAGCMEAVLIREGYLTEASASNVFVVRGGIILTPPKNHLILPGITYDVIIDLARQAGLALEARPVTEAEVRTADELWLTSSSKEVVAIVRLDEQPVGHGLQAGKPGPIYKRMRKLFDDAKASMQTQRSIVHA